MFDCTLSLSIVDAVRGPVEDDEKDDSNEGELDGA